MYSYRDRYIANRQLVSKGPRHDDPWNIKQTDYEEKVSPQPSKRNGFATNLYTQPMSSDDSDIQSPELQLNEKPARKINKRGKLITFYKNGDAHFKGLPVSVSQKQFATFETLLDFLNTKIHTSSGVRTIFSWPERKVVTDLKDFQIGHHYIVSDSGRLNDQINYGEVKPQVWINKKMSAKKFRRHEAVLLQNSKEVGRLSTDVKPRVLSIISNSDRTSKEKVMLNPHTNQTFEEILLDIGNMVNILSPPVGALFTYKKPHKKVLSFSQLFNELRDHDTFLACGREMMPSERDAPKTTQSDSAINTKPKQKRVPGKRMQKMKDYSSDADEPSPRAIDHQPRQSLFGIVKAGNRFKDAIQPPLTPPPAPRAAGLQKRNQKADHDQLTVSIEIDDKRRAFYCPTTYQANDGFKPDRKLHIDWVYGYRGRDARNNLYVLPSGELLYYVASIAVMYDRKRHLQRHYTGHNEDITSMALHPNKYCVATGQATGGGRPDTMAHIRVWDARSLSTYIILGFGSFKVAVGCLAFSLESEGQYLLSLDESKSHTLSVWAWQEERTVVKASLIQDEDFKRFGTASDTVVWGVFHPFDDRIIITYGKQHIFFWKIYHDGSSPTRLIRDKMSGVFEDGVPKFVTSVCFTADGEVLSGDSNGNIVAWSQDGRGAFSVNKHISNNLRNAHKKSVFCLNMASDGTLISGGGSELKTWDSSKQYQPLDKRKIPESTGFIRSLALQSESGLHGYLYIGTTKNQVLEGRMDDKLTVLIHGHCEELWALATHHAEHSFFTAGYDQQVCKWSAVSHKIVWRCFVDKPCVSIALDEHEELLALGTVEGRLVIFDAHDGAHQFSVQVGSGAINCTSFSADGRMLAVGSQDCGIYIFDVIDGGHHFRKHKEGHLRGHKKFVMQLDWSEDSRFLQSVSGDYDLLFWDVFEMRQEKDGRSMRDVTWHTQSCMLGYCIAGAWSHIDRDDNEITTVSKSLHEAYLATGDNCGSLRLFKYPASTQRPDFHEKKCYSSHVANIRFLFDSSYLITAGGIDAGLIQWILSDATTPRRQRH